MAKGTGKFGWCLTEQHDKCLTRLVSEDRQCTCDCHKENKDNI